MKQVRCVSLNGFSADRTPEAMRNTPVFARELSRAWGIDLEVIGQPELPRNLDWFTTLRLSAPTLQRAQAIVDQTFELNDQLVLITPRCATALATLPMVMKHYPDAIVLWFDAHGDLNTPETTTSSYLGGMPLAAAIGEWESGYGAGLPTNQLVHIGARSFGAGEKALIKSRGIRTISKSSLNTDIESLMNLVRDREVFIHLDTDVFDPSEVVAEYAEPDGLLRGDIREICEIIARGSHFLGIEITEMSPKTDEQRVSSHSAVLEAIMPLQSVANAHLA